MALYSFSLSEKFIRKGLSIYTQSRDIPAEKLTGADYDTDGLPLYEYRRGMLRVTGIQESKPPTFADLASYYGAEVVVPPAIQMAGEASVTLPTDYKWFVEDITVEDDGPKSITTATFIGYGKWTKVKIVDAPA